MKFVRRSSLIVILLAGLLLCQRSSGGAQIQPTDDHMAVDESGGAAGEPAEVQIARAIAAGPLYVTSSARIVGADAQGKRIVLRKWSADMAVHKAKPTNAEPGIIYMLAGATQRSDLSDKTGAGITTGPHWMILWPFDPKTTGLSATRKDTGAYIMLAGTPYYSLSYLGLARAARISGETDKSRKAYQDLFALWKDADPDLAILAQARKGYAALP